MTPAYNKSGSYAMKPFTQEEELDEASVWDAQAEDSFTFNTRNKTEKGTVASEQTKVLKVGGKRSIEDNDSAIEHKSKHQNSEHPSGISGLTSTLGNTNTMEKQEVGFIPISKKFEDQQKYDIDEEGFAIKMGTSAPINIPSNNINIKVSSPGEGRTQSFVPPHLMGEKDPDEKDPDDISRSVLKREQLRQRRSVLESTGFLEKV